MKNEDFGKPIVAFTQFVPGRIHLKDHLRQRSLLWGEPSDSAKNAANVAYWRAPCKDGAFQWVQAPPGNRSSRKQSEQSWR
jgi:hypothetical protein